MSFEQVEAAIDEVIEEMMAAPPESGEFERARTRLVAAHIYEQDSQFALAMNYGLSLTIGLTVEDVEAWPDRIEMVTPEDVQDVARNYLIKKEAVTGRLSPLAPGEGLNLLFWHLQSFYRRTSQLRRKWWYSMHPMALRCGCPKNTLYP